MLAIAGIVIVFLAVLGGYVLEQGNPLLLVQPAELLIVVGAAVGITIVANPVRVIRKLTRSARDVLRAPTLNRMTLIRYLLMLYEVFGYAQRAGAMNLEDDIENPRESRIFSRYPDFLRDVGMRDFLCDSLRMLVIGITNAAELDRLMDLDIEVQRRGDHEPAGALGAIAEALPGLGIVAAVLGVVITMSSIGGAPESIGQKVAAALVGTFIGILLCYGVVGPLASRLEANIEERAQFLQVVRTAVVAHARGATPILAVEYARRSIPVELRPAFIELEMAIRRDAKIPTMSEQALPTGARTNKEAAVPASQ
jgi:chemotaxis protein MotA